MPRFNATVRVDLEGPSGNAYVILGLTSVALKDAGATPEEVEQFNAEATSSDYENLLKVCDQWVTLIKHNG